MRIISYLFICTVALLWSCSNDSDPERDDNKTKPSAEAIAQRDKVFSNLGSFFDSREGIPTTEEIKLYLEEFPEVDRVTTDNDYIVIHITGGQIITIDLTPLPLHDNYEVQQNKLSEEVSGALEKQEYPIVAQSLDTSIEMADFIKNNSNVKLSMSRASSNSNRDITLRRKNILFWCPWENMSSDGSAIKSIAEAAGMKCTIQELDFSADSFKEWSKYDIVFVSTHCSKDGKITLPYQLAIEQYPNSAKTMELAYIFVWINKQARYVPVLRMDASVFKKNLGNLSNTMVWMFACHSGENKSEIKSVLSECKVADFFGTEGVSGGNGPLNLFRDFIVAMMQGKNSGLAFNKGVAKAKCSYIEPLQNNAKISFNFCRYGTKNVAYNEVLTTSVPISRANNPIFTVGAQLRINDATDWSKAEYGIVLKNIKTGKFTKIKASKSDTSSKKYDGLNVVNIQMDISRQLTEGETYCYAGYYDDGNQLLLANRSLTITYSSYFVHRYQGSYHEERHTDFIYSDPSRNHSSDRETDWDSGFAIAQGTWNKFLFECVSGLSTLNFTVDTENKTVTVDPDRYYDSGLKIKSLEFNFNNNPSILHINVTSHKDYPVGYEDFEDTIEFHIDEGFVKWHQDYRDYTDSQGYITHSTGVKDGVFTLVKN